MRTGRSRRSCTASRAARSWRGGRSRSGSTCPSPVLSRSRNPMISGRSQRCVPLDRLLVETDAPFLAPEPYRGKTNEPAYVVHTAAALGQGEGPDAGSAGGRRPPPTSIGSSGRCRAQPKRAARRELSLHHPRLRLIDRSAPRRQRLGELRSHESAQPAPAVRRARRAARRWRHRHGADRYRARSARAAARCRREADRRRRLHARSCRPHARHRRSSDGRLRHEAAGRRVVRCGDARQHHEPVRLLLCDAAGRELSADPGRQRHPSARADYGSRARGAISRSCRSCRTTARSRRSASASATSPTRPTFAELPESSIPLLEGLDVWIVDALRYTPHPSHFSVAQALEWIEQLKPKRAILTHLHVDLDYEALKRELPANVEPAYDGMTIEF